MTASTYEPPRLMSSRSVSRAVTSSSTPRESVLPTFSMKEFAITLPAALTPTMFCVSCWLVSLVSNRVSEAKTRPSTRRALAPSSMLTDSSSS